MMFNKVECWVPQAQQPNEVLKAGGRVAGKLPSGKGPSGTAESEVVCCNEVREFEKSK